MITLFKGCTKMICVVHPYLLWVQRNNIIYCPPFFVCTLSPQPTYPPCVCVCVCARARAFLKVYIDGFCCDKLHITVRLCNKISRNSIYSSPSKVSNNTAAPNGISVDHYIIPSASDSGRKITPAAPKSSGLAAQRTDRKIPAWKDVEDSALFFNMLMLHRLVGIV